MITPQRRNIPSQFTANGTEYLHVIPAKYLMRSSLIFEVIMRGDIFALDIDKQELVIIKPETIENTPL